MRFQKLDLNLLVCLDALLAEQSVSKAARRVFLSQSGMSDALARLRDYFGDDLLVQVGKTMVPTTLAQSLTQPIREILARIEAVTSSASDFDPATCDRLITVIVSDYSATVLLPKLMAKLASDAPGVRTDFLPLNSTCKEAFDKGLAHLIVIPEPFVFEGHPYEPLFTDDFVCVVWSENRLVGDSLTMEQYLSLGHVCVNMGEWRVPTHEAWVLKRLGEDRRHIEVTVPTFEMAFRVLRGTKRIATVHLRQAQMYVQKYS